MGSNLSKRRSQSSGDLLGGGAAGGVKLGASLPNHLDSANSLPQEHRHLATHLDSYERRSPPPHPLLSFPACPVHHTALIEKYPFINSESTFSVEVTKGSGGLGLSVTGGEPWPGLVRIKRLFPHQPAAMSARLQPGDVLLAASGVPLLGLTNYEALEVLRATPSEVKLTVCRPPAGLGGGGVLGPPPPPLPPPRDLHTHLDHHHTEFEIWMEKQNGSLGFTLRKEDQSALGHYVRALVREPALSDTRIRPGDKIIAVNDVSMSGMSHEEAVCFLRQCGTRVKLRLYRDPVQTPLPPHSPPPTAQSSTATLGKEAQDMLTELRKSQSPQDSSGSSSCHSKGSSPRKRRLTRTPPPLGRQ
ncbi:hypothetical protein AAG570_005891 [Ranatra chinensis]|uniref:PDZ domain-containing protein n=1 Tax=Ranatra chinensis TaxID=642074 RepID=A0ABD0XWF8_9HEMI